MKAMILAAGRGERMRPLTDTIPKALLRVADRPLIEHHVRALVKAGVSEIVINLAWLGEQISAYLGDGDRFDVAISYSDEGEQALETAGGVIKALPQLGSEPFWLVNGDVYTDYAFAVPELAPKDAAHLVLVDNPDHNPGGDFGLQDDRVVNSSTTMFTYSGIGFFSPEIFSGHADGPAPLAPILRELADQQQLAGAHHDGCWFDIGTPQRLEQINQIVSA